MRRLGTWLAILAIALQAAWPLVAAAKPRGVALVPLCTVDGVTHYLEVPLGETPPDKSSGAHHQHCAFCFLGERFVSASQPQIALLSDGRAECVPAASTSAVTSFRFITQGARAPPLLPVRQT